MSGLARPVIVWIAMAVPAAALGAPVERRTEPMVVVARLDNRAINPVTARFVSRALREAEAVGARCLVLTIDTPGGLVNSTRAIVQEILASRVPVVVYVAPSGARAASAGVFITMAAHVAAMAPGTHIGAAHPVQIGGADGDRQIDLPEGREAKPSLMEGKILSDTVAWARALAELRGRNSEWAAQAVRESVSVPASEALDRGVIDLIAEHEQDLLRSLHGRAIDMPGEQVRLEIAGAAVQRVEMGSGDRILASLANPTLAFLFLAIGFYAVLFELYSPGWGVAGVLGIMALLLGFMGMSVLPLNYAGVALLLVAVGLFAAEAFIASYGLLALAGSVCLVLGGLLLIDSPAGFQRLSLTVLLPVAAATALVSVFLLTAVVRAHRGAIRTGPETVVASEGVAEEDFALVQDHYQGFVRTRGELWRATSPLPVARNQPVSVEARVDLTLRVRPSDGAPAGSAHGHRPPSQD